MNPTALPQDDEATTARQPLTQLRVVSDDTEEKKKKQAGAAVKAPQPAVSPSPAVTEAPAAPTSSGGFGDILKANVDNTVDIAKSILATPIKIGNDVLNAGVDVANSAIKFFDPDKLHPYQLPHNELPDFIKPQTTAGSVAQTAASWYLGGKVIDAGLAAHGIFTSLSQAGQVEKVKTIGNALTELGRVVTEPSQVTMGAAGNYAKEAIKDFILNAPEDDTIATMLRDNHVVDHPFFDLMAIDDDDSCLIRRMKHAVEGFAIGTTMDAAFETGRWGIKALKHFGATAAEAGEVSEDAVNAYMKEHPFDYTKTIGYRFRNQLADMGLDDGHISRIMDFWESYAATMKSKDQTIADYLEKLNLNFEGVTHLVTDQGESALGAFKHPQKIDYNNEFANELKILIDTTKDQDSMSATMLHEMAHFFMFDTQWRGQKDAIHRAFYEMQTFKSTPASAAEKFWINAGQFIKHTQGVDGEYLDQKETFALAFEDWLKTNKAPNKYMEAAFLDCKKWMQKFSQDLLNTNASTEDLNKVFAPLFTTPDMDAEVKALYQKGFFVKEAAEEVANAFKEDANNVTGDAKTLFRRAPTGRTLRTGMINFDYVNEPKDMKIALEHFEQETAKYLDGFTVAPHSKEQVLAEAKPLIANILSDDDGAAKLLAKKLADPMNQPAAAYAGNYVMINYAHQLLDLSKFYEEAEKQASLEAMKNIEAQFKLKSLTFTNLRLVMGSRVTGAARFLQALQIPVGNGTKEAAEAVGDVAAQGMENGDVRKAIKQVAMLNGDPVKTARFTAAWQTKAVSTINEYFTNSLLSNPATSLVNLVGNTAVTGISPMEYIIGGYMKKGLAKAADLLGIKSAWANEGGEEAVRQGSHLFTGMNLMWKEARDTMKAAWDSEHSIWGASNQTGLLEYGPERWIASSTYHLDPTSTMGRLLDTVGQIINLPSRALMATDDFSKSLNGRAMLFNDLCEEAISKGIKDTQTIKDYVAENWGNHFVRYLDEGRLTKEIITDPRAQEYALLQTFSNDRGKLVGYISQLKRDYPLLHPLIPFVRTPARLVDWAVQRTPLGLLYREQRDAFLKGGVESSKVLGQWAVGGMFLGSATILAQSGKITGGGPSNPGARKTMMDLGWQPYSIRIGDKWYSFNRMDPIGSFFGVVGDYLEITKAASDSEEDSRTVADAATAMLTAIAKNTTSKTYLQSIGNIISVIENPDLATNGKKLKSYAASVASGFIPRILTNLARDTGVSDPYMKEASGFLDRIKARMPGLSDQLPTQYSWLTGEAKTYDDFSLVDFAPDKPVAKDQIHQELLSYGAKLGGPSRIVDGVRLNDEQYSRFCELHGNLKIGGRTLMDALEREASSPAYQKLPEGQERLKALNSIIGEYRESARNQLRREYAELAPKTIFSAAAVTEDSDIQKLLKYGQ